MAADAPPHRSEYVAAVLRRQILDRTYPVGSELPTVASLATEFGVSHMTVKRALAVLSAEGVISTSRGARTRVAQLPDEQAKPLTEQIKDLRARVDGLDERVTTLESHTGKPTRRGRT
jgi:DNA-binding GntR family transcriptional regulator